MNELIAVNPKSLDKAEDWEDFISLWAMSKEIDTCNQFFKGDIAQKVSVKYGNDSLGKFAQAVGEPYQTIIGYRRVARAFLTDKRGLNLSWTHYHLASHTDEYDKRQGTFKSDNRAKWINEANDEGWSSNRLAVEIKKQKALVKETAAIYYGQYLDKVKNVLTHIDKGAFTRSEREQFIERIDTIFLDIKDYWTSDLLPAKKKPPKSDSISKPKMSKRKIYNTKLEADEALKKHKKKKGDVLVRHRNDGKWELVSKEALRNGD